MTPHHITPGSRFEKALLLILSSLSRDPYNDKGIFAKMFLTQELLTATKIFDANAREPFRFWSSNKDNHYWIYSGELESFLSDASHFKSYDDVKDYTLKDVAKTVVNTVLNVYNDCDENTFIKSCIIIYSMSTYGFDDKSSIYFSKALKMLLNSSTEECTDVLMKTSEILTMPALSHFKYKFDILLNDLKDNLVKRISDTETNITLINALLNINFSKFSDDMLETKNDVLR